MRVRTLTLLAVVASALAGCGDAGAPVRANDTSVTIRLDDYLIRPQELRVPKGRRLTFTVTNRGRLGHTFRIRTPNHNVFALTTIEPGETVERSVRLAAGRYTMYCALANHEELGMHGTLTVG